PEISIPFSLTFIVLVLAVTTITSLRASKKQEAEEAVRAEEDKRRAAGSR
ncbi:TerC family protein, partial [Streptomyces caelestis]